MVIYIVVIYIVVQYVGLIEQEVVNQTEIRPKKSDLHRQSVHYKRPSAPFCTFLHLFALRKLSLVGPI